MTTNLRPLGCRPGGCARLCTDAGLATAYAEHWSRVLGRARRVVADPHLAEEAAQETFTRAWRACHTFDPDQGPLVNWLLVIAGNVSVDFVRARNRRPPVVSAADAEGGPHDTGGIDLVVHRAALRDALQRLSPDHRRAVIETVVRDRPHADVATELGINIATLRTRLHYGLRRLRMVMAAATS